MRMTHLGALVASASLAIALTGCTSDPVQSTGGNSSGSDQAIKTQKENAELHAALPAEIRKSGSVVAANTGSFPPYTIVGSNGTDLDGAVADLSNAIGEILGITIKHETVEGLSGLLTGMQANRYQLSLGPVGDFTDRQKQATFIGLFRPGVGVRGAPVTV